MENSHETTHPIVKEQLRHAARTLSHLNKIEQTNDALNSVADFLEQSLIDTRANNPDELCDMMVTQARVLDASFHHTMGRYRGTGSEMSGMMDALKFQQQTVRTALAWKKLKADATALRRYVDDEKNPRGTK